MKNEWPNRYKPIICASVRPELSDDGIRESLQGFKDDGYGGIAVHGRGKKEETVEEFCARFFPAVKRYCDISRELGMDIWIFDEWGFPSGRAAGTVLTADTRPKKLNKTYDFFLEPGESIALPTPERMLAASAFPIDRFGVYLPNGPAEQIKARDNTITYTAKVRSRIVVVTWENLSYHTYDWRGERPEDDTVGTVDIMSSAVVRKFLDNMHERYVPYISEEFGKTVKGFFYDEPEICWEFPYTPELPEFFLQMHGYDMTDILAEIVTFKEQDALPLGKKELRAHIAKSYADYTSAWNALLAKNFYGQIEQWCHEHNLLSVGHQDLDHTLETLSTVSGKFSLNNVHNDMPGIDVIFNQIESDSFSDFPRFAGSIKRASNKAGAASETFACMGDAMPPDQARFVMEHQILRGIDQFFLYLPEFDPQSAPYVPDIMHRIEKTAEMLNQGTARAKIGLYVPLDYIAAGRRSNDPHYINCHASVPKGYVNEIARLLCYTPFDFDYVWEEHMDNLFERGIDTLIVVGTPLSDAECKKMVEYQNAGGKIITMLWHSHPCIEGPAYYNTRELMKNLSREVKVESEDRMISMTSRQLDEGVLYAFLNEADAQSDAKMTFPGGNVQYYDFYSDEWREWDGDGLFMPCELKLFLVSNKTESAKEKIVKTTLLDRWTLNGKPIDALLPWNELGLEGFFGCAEYKTEFDFDGGIADIYLGEVRYIAEVVLDGKEYRVPFAPWRFKTELSRGHHEMTVKIHNTSASARFAGRKNVYPTEEGYPWEQKYLNCGLLGTPKVNKIEKL